jgi:hypothetical protein
MSDTEREANENSLYTGETPSIGLTKRWFVGTPAFYFKLNSMCFVRLDTLWDSIEYSPFEKGSAVR